MDTRRDWMMCVLATSAVAACGCSRKPEGGAADGTVAAAPSNSKPEAWEPIDPAFDGCAGG